MNLTYVTLYRYERGYSSHSETQLFIPISFDRKVIKKSWLKRLIERLLTKGGAGTNR